MNFISIICATYFELTYPVVQNICDKKTHFKEHNVLQTSLVFTVIYWVHFEVILIMCCIDFNIFDNNVYITV